MKPEYRNVVDVIVKNDLCIGCGLCTGVCPVQVLRMDFNEFGELQPVEFKPGCLPTCNICLEVCPFWDRNKNEDQLSQALFSQEPAIQFTQETGYYLQAFAGYAKINGLRENGSSGGIATWLLENLVTQKFVDHVICVRSNDDAKQLFKYTVCSSVQEIRAASRSCYYPVELSEMIRFILDNEGTYAITGVPCFIKGLRLAMDLYPKLQRRIAFLCGLVCSQTQSKLYAEQLCRMKGGDPAYITKAEFRIKDPSRPANDYGFRFECSSGKISEGKIFFKQGMGALWLNDCFTPNACHYCDDIFAETADVTFMDAWLPQFQTDPKGHNLILVRSKVIAEILERGVIEDELSLHPIPIEKVIDSQAGGIKRKRKVLALRIERDQNKHGLEYIPKKRVTSSAGLEIEEKLLFWLRVSLRKKFRNHYIKDPSYTPLHWELSFTRFLIFMVTKLSFFSKKMRKLTKAVNSFDLPS